MSAYPQRLVAEQYARFAVPATYAPAALSPSSASSAAARASASSSVPPSATSPFSSSALAGHPYRSLMTSSAGVGAGSEEREREAPGWNSLVAPHLNRAVHVEAQQHHPSADQQWFAQPAPIKSFDAFGAPPQKHSAHLFPLPVAALPAPALGGQKDLAMPRVEARMEALPLTRSVSLPVMPAYLESSCFSLAKAAMKPAEMMAHVQTHLKTAGVVVAERTDRKLEVSAAAG